MINLYKFARVIFMFSKLGIMNKLQGTPVMLTGAMSPSELAFTYIFYNYCNRAISWLPKFHDVNIVSIGN